MPLFYFHMQDGTEITDSEGTELADVAAVRDYAVDCARSLLREDVSRGEFNIHWRFEIIDETGTPVMMFPFADALNLSQAKRVL